MATIRDAGISGDFIHEPLFDPGAEIRLIRVHPSGDKESQIWCTISTHSLNDSPPYIAISYTWGDSGKRRWIWVNELQVSIGYNSWLALWQARLHRIQQPLWIDVLSIDQTNDYEKSIQVGMMGTIYKGAEYVLASVGDQEDDSEYLAEQVHALTEYIEHWRRRECTKEDPLAPSGYCCGCGQLLPAGSYICQGCTDTSLFCSGCADGHDEAGHALLLFPQAHQDGCFKCYRRLPFKWYESRDTHIRFCRACGLPGQKEKGVGFGWTLCDPWGPIDKPAKDRRPDGRYFDTSKCSRVFRMTRETRLRSLDAFSLFSFRKYFTRLWILQELKFAHYVLIVCGESMFTLDALWKFVDDAYKYPELRSHLTWYSEYLRGLLNIDVLTDPDSLWGHVVKYCGYHCADTRDCVFGLLSFSPEHAIRPDYTKSSLQVLLQLLKYRANAVGGANGSRAARDAMEHSMKIVGAFCLGPLAAQIADMLRLRRLAHAAPSISPELLTFDYRSQRRIALQSRLSSRVWEDAAGNMVAALSEDTTLPFGRHRDHDVQYISHHTQDTVVMVRSLLGKVVALADKRLRTGDILLFFQDTHPMGGMNPPVYGLIIRSTQRDIYVVVGQVVVNHGTRPNGPGSYSAPGTNPHGLELEEGEWWVFMAPADLLLFIAQDMHSEIDSPEWGDPGIRLTFRPEETAKRLITSVTTDWNSSYAIRKSPRDYDPPQGPAVVLRSDSMDFP